MEHVSSMRASNFRRSWTRRAAHAVLWCVAVCCPTLAQDFQPIRVNSGGDVYTDIEGNVWNTDAGFGPSVTVSTPAQIGGTDDDSLFQTQRFSAPVLSYAFDVPNGTYQVRMLFAELWSGAFSTGARRFHVGAEGATFFPRTDVFAEAGANVALVKTFNVAVVDGRLNLDFVQDVENPIVNAIEVTATTAPTTPTALVAGAAATEISLTWAASSDDTGVVEYEVESCAGAGCDDFEPVGTTDGTSATDSGLTPGSTYRYRVRASDAQGNDSPYSAIATVSTGFGGPTAAVVRVNAGGLEYVDVSGNTWEADRGFNGGLTGTAPVTIAGTPDSLLYQSLRWMPTDPALEYAFDIPSGDYLVKLHFAETFPGAFIEGGRVFDVEVEGVPVISDLDVFAQVGANSALLEEVATTVIDGQLNIRFVRGRSQLPFVSAIEVIAVSNPDPPDTTAPSAVENLTINRVSRTELDLDWDEATDDTGVTGYSIERCTGAACSNFSELATVEVAPFSDVGLVCGTVYRYRVRAFDEAGNFGAFSGIVIAPTCEQCKDRKHDRHRHSKKSHGKHKHGNHGHGRDERGRHGSHDRGHRGDRR